MKRIVLVGALAFVALASAAPAPAFGKVPDQAVEMLKSTRSKTSLSSGLVFVNGHYVKPSYRVRRVGTVLFVNDVQISGQIVPWRSFLATQDGYVPPAPVAKPAVAAPPPKKEKTVDDLFDDEPAPAAKAEPVAAAASSESASADEVGAFTANEKSQALLKKIESARARVHGRLRDGCICFYGSRYAPLSIPPRTSRKLLDVLPEAIRDANDAAELEASLRAKGFGVMLGRLLCEDLMAHQADYLQIVKRREQIKEDESLGLTR